MVFFVFVFCRRESFFILALIWKMEGNHSPPHSFRSTKKAVNALMHAVVCKDEESARLSIEEGESLDEYYVLIYTAACSFSNFCLSY